MERYLERIESSYDSCKLSIEKIRKYFRSSDRYLALYMDGVTGDNVLEKMASNAPTRPSSITNQPSGQTTNDA